MPVRPPDHPSMPAPDPSGTMQGELRLAELVAAFSLVCDLAMGHPPEEVMRACLIATSLAREMGRAEEEVADIYWTTLLAHSGCTAFAHEQAALFAGDEIAVNAAGSKADFTEPREAFAFMRELSRGRRPMDRVRIVFGSLTAGRGFEQELATANCEIAATFAGRLALPPAVRDGLLDMFERWDGAGDPRQRSGEEIASPARFAQLAHQAAVFASARRGPSPRPPSAPRAPRSRNPSIRR